MTILLKATATAALAALCLLRGGPAAYAGDAAGTTAFQFLQLGVGARPSAMGEAFAGVTGDASSVYWNPAGLAALDRGELSVSHALWLEDITYSSLAGALPVNGGTVGAAFNVLNTGSIDKADNTGLRLGDSYNMAEVMALLSYARQFGALALGGNLKFISSRIEEETAQSVAADLGAIFGGLSVRGRRLNLGLAVQNLGTRAEYVSEAFSLPVTVRAGAALEAYKGLLLVSDLVYRDETVDIHAGAEYTRAFGTVVVAARAGYKDDTVKELGALSGLTAGLGVGWTDFQLDYAWNSFTDLGAAHRLSLGIKFGSAGREVPRTETDSAARGSI